MGAKDSPLLNCTLFLIGKFQRGKKNLVLRIGFV